MLTQKLPGATTGTAAESLRLIEIYKDPASSPLAKSRAGNRLCQINEHFVLGRVYKKSSAAIKKYGDTALDDIAACARMGLLEALDNFESKGYNFLSYAGWYIDREINSCIAMLGVMCKKNASERLATMRSKYKAFMTGHGRPPTDKELSVATGFPMSTMPLLREYWLLTTGIISTDKLMLECDKPLLDTIAATSNPESDDTIWELVSLHAGSADNYELMHLRYVEDLSFKAIGERQGITKQRVSQRHDRIIKKLRKHSDCL